MVVGYQRFGVKIERVWVSETLISYITTRRHNRENHEMNTLKLYMTTVQCGIFSVISFETILYINVAILCVLLEFFSLSPHPSRLWGPPSLLYEERKRFEHYTQNCNIYTKYRSKANVTEDTTQHSHHTLLQCIGRSFRGGKAAAA